MNATKWFMVALTQLAGGTLVSVLLALVLVSPDVWSAIWSTAQHTDTIFSWHHVALHFAVGTTFWLFLVLSWEAIKSAPAKRVVRAAGSVMVETLVIMPLFLLLSFGMGQLSINNVAGILANVAVYEAARAAWVWMPEEQSEQTRGAISEGTAEQKARVAAAMAMLPVAPGDYHLGSLDGDETVIAEKARLAAVLSHVPAGGALGDMVGDLSGDLAGLGSQGTAGLGNENPLDFQTFFHALGSSNFVLRTLSKFSLAYNSTEIEIDDDTLEVTLTYLHYQGMPYVGRVFGEYKLFGGPTWRPGYYAEIKRVYGFQKQENVPNAAMPQNALWPIPEPPTGETFYGGVDE